MTLNQMERFYMKKVTRNLIVLLIIAMFLFISCDDTLTHDMNGDVEVDDDEQEVVTRTVTWMNYDGTVLETAEVKKGQAPVHPVNLNPTPPDPTYQLDFDTGIAFVPENPVVVYQYKFKVWVSHDQDNNNKDQVFTATYETRGPGSDSDPDGEVLELEDFEFKSLSDNKNVLAHVCKLTDFTGTGDLYIPKFYNGQLVVDVNLNFRGNTKVERLILPDSVSVLSGPFTHLKRLVISNNLKQIPSDSFRDCKTLIRVEIPESIETKTYAGEAYIPKDNWFGESRIGYGAFRGCTNLTYIDIPDKIETIGEFAFAGCIKLKNIQMPTFDDPNDPGKKTSNLKEIALAAFMNCEALANIVIPPTVELIGDAAFKDCSSLDGAVIPAEVEIINPMTFENCIRLENIHLQDGLKTISWKAFNNCKALKSLTIPKTVTMIEYRDGGVIVGCESLDTITVSPENKKYSDKDMNVIYLTVDEDESDTAKDTLIAGCKTSKIPEDTKHIADYAFDGHTGLTEDPGIGDNPTLESIGHRAFWGCLDNGAKQDIYLENNIIKIGYAAFWYKPIYIDIKIDDETIRDVMNQTCIFSKYSVEDEEFNNTQTDPEKRLFDYTAAVGHEGGGSGIGIYLEPISK